MATLQALFTGFIAVAVIVSARPQEFDTTSVTTLRDPSNLLLTPPQPLPRKFDPKQIPPELVKDAGKCPCFVQTFSVQPSECPTYSCPAAPTCTATPTETITTPIYVPHGTICGFRDSINTTINGGCSSCQTTCPTSTIYTAFDLNQYNATVTFDADPQTCTPTGGCMAALCIVEATTTIPPCFAGIMTKSFTSTLPCETDCSQGCRTSWVTATAKPEGWAAKSAGYL